MPNKNPKGKNGQLGQTGEPTQTQTRARTQASAQAQTQASLQAQDAPLKTGDTGTKTGAGAKASKSQALGQVTAKSRPAAQAKSPAGDDVRQAERLTLSGESGQVTIPIQRSVPVVPSQIDRVRAYSDPAVNALIDEGIRERLNLYAGQPATLIGKRIEALEREWDIERFMAVKASSLAMLGLVLGIVRARRWLLLPLLALPFLFQHSTTGTCMSTPLVRRMGFRTRHEIEAEKYALKVLRGDFGELDVPRALAVEQALAAVKR